MAEGTESWPHHVELRLAGEDFHAKLRDIEEWLQAWEIPYQVCAALSETGSLRICFAEEKFARAFIFHKGGTLAPGDEAETAMLEDKADEVEFQRLANDRIE